MQLFVYLLFQHVICWLFQHVIVINAYHNMLLKQTNCPKQFGIFMHDFHLLFLSFFEIDE